MAMIYINAYNFSADEKQIYGGFSLLYSSKSSGMNGSARIEARPTPRSTSLFPTRLDLRMQNR
jgi:hypothetical protein